MSDPGVATIRVATHTDAAAMVDIEVAGYHPSHTPGPPPTGDEDPWERRGPEDVLVADLDGAGGA